QAAKATTKIAAPMVLSICQIDSMDPIDGGSRAASADDGTTGTQISACLASIDDDRLRLRRKPAHLCGKLTLEALRILCHANLVAGINHLDRPRTGRAALSQ